MNESGDGMVDVPFSAHEHLPSMERDEGDLHDNHIYETRKHLLAI